MSANLTDRPVIAVCHTCAYGLFGAPSRPFKIRRVFGDFVAWRTVAWHEKNGHQVVRVDKR